MPQSPQRLQNDLKCVEWEVKPYYTHPLCRRYTLTAFADTRGVCSVAYALDILTMHSNYQAVCESIDATNGLQTALYIPLVCRLNVSLFC